MVNGRYSRSTLVNPRQPMKLVSSSAFDPQNRPGLNAPLSASPSVVLPHNPEEHVNLGDYLRLVTGHWGVVLSMGLGGCLLAILISWVQTPLFRARTSVEVQSVNVDFLNMRQARPVADSSQGTDLLMDVQTQIEVLQTAVLTENTKKAMTQIGPKRDWQPYPAAWRTLAHNDSGPVAPMDKILDSVADRINVRPVG